MLLYPVLHYLRPMPWAAPKVSIDLLDEVGRAVPELPGYGVLTHGRATVQCLETGGAVGMTELLRGDSTGSPAGGNGNAVEGLAEVGQHPLPGGMHVSFLMEPEPAPAEGLVAATVPGRAREKVRLEVLDWGGHGPALVLLAGLGESGHIYNDLAPRLTDQFRVVALTRRGHGASSHADTSTYVFDTLAADIGAVMDSLQLQRASLIGHSIAGSEITRFTVRFPHRVDKLVYLDASHDFAGIDRILGANPAWPPEFKPPLGTRNDTLNAAREWSKRYRFGYWSDALESGILRSPDSDPAADRCLLRDAILHPKEYRAVRVPALALTARYTMENWFFYLDPVADSVKWRDSKHWLTMVVQPWLDNGHERFRREVRTHQTIEFETDHHLFNSHPDRTLREIRGFLLSPTAP